MRLSITEDQAKIIIYLAKAREEHRYPSMAGRLLGMPTCQTRLQRLLEKGIVQRFSPVGAKKSLSYYELTDLGWRYYAIIEEIFDYLIAT